MSSLDDWLSVFELKRLSVFVSRPPGPITALQPNHTDVAANWKAVRSSKRRSLLERAAAALKLHHEMCAEDMGQEVSKQKLFLVCTDIYGWYWPLTELKCQQKPICVLCCFYAPYFLINFIISQQSPTQSPAPGRVPMGDWQVKGCAVGEKIYIINSGIRVRVKVNYMRGHSEYEQKYISGFFRIKQIKKMCNINHHYPATITFILKVNNKRRPLTSTSVSSLTQQRCS